MTVWFTSDTHFGHKNIIKYSSRPFADVAEMNEALVDNWNSVVHPGDTVFHLGDVALGPWVEWDGVLRRLNGYIVLVVGNHDRVFKGMSAKEQEKFAPHYRRWFDEIHDSYPKVNVAGRTVNLSHFPYDGDSHDGDRYTQYRLEDDGTTLIHGHTHAEFAKDGLSSRISRSKKGTLQIHVGMDAWDYTPVSEDQIEALLRGVE